MHTVLKTLIVLSAPRFVFVFFNQTLMSDLEEKDKCLNKLKMKVDNLLASNHPASDQIEVSAFFSLHRMACICYLFRLYAHVLPNRSALVFS